MGVPTSAQPVPHHPSPLTLSRREELGRERDGLQTLPGCLFPDGMRAIRESQFNGIERQDLRRKLVAEARGQIEFQLSAESRGCACPAAAAPVHER